MMLMKLLIAGAAKNAENTENELFRPKTAFCSRNVALGQFTLWQSKVDLRQMKGYLRRMKRYLS